MKKTHYWRLLALFGLALLGFALRLYGLNWDQGNSFHPDERQIMFHVTMLAWPHSLAQFLDPGNSPLNPHFFAYGSFPLYLLAILGNILTRFFPSLGSFANLTLLGRVVNAILDSGTVLLTGWLGLLLADDHTTERKQAWTLALLAAALVAFTPFQLQLSHFYAVDTMLLFFVTLTMLACVALVDSSTPVRWSLLAGLGYGLALATKFSAAPLIVPLFVAVALRGRHHGLFQSLGMFFSSLTAAGLVFLIAMPYALLDWTNFREQVATQGDLARGLLDLPYVRQFVGTIPYLYEAQNIVLWGLGLMLGLTAFVGFGWLLWHLLKRLDSPWLVILAWVVPYNIIVGSFYVKFMRYMLPIYPFLTLMAAALLAALLYHQGAINRRFPRAALPIGATVLVLAGTAFQGLALLNVYSQPNTRIQASLWMYSHLKPGSVLTYEQWDDPLPIPVGNNDPSQFVQATYPDASGQVQTGLDLYGDDTLFYLAAQFENHPNLFGVTLDDSNADESYSVFDHPTVHIFVRENPYPYTPDQLLHKLLAGVKLPATNSTRNSVPARPPIPVGARVGRSGWEGLYGTLSGGQVCPLVSPHGGRPQAFSFTARFPTGSLYEERSRQLVRHYL